MSNMDGPSDFYVSVETKLRNLRCNSQRGGTATYGTASITEFTEMSHFILAGAFHYLLFITMFARFRNSNVNNSRHQLTVLH